MADDTDFRLTIMEREEAINVVRVLTESTYFDDRELEGLRTLIPELRESEDERIRKALIDGVSQIRCKGDVTREQMIAYLERQKYDRMKPIYDARESFESALEKAWNDYHNGYENVDKLEDDYVECAHAKGFREGYLFGLEKQKENPKSADSIPSDCMSDAKCEDRWHKVGDSLPDNPREVLCKDEAGNYFIGRYYVGEGWEISNYDDEDKPHHLNPPVSKWIDFPSEKQKEQKPAEWSEEDENMAYFINQFLEYHEASDPTAKSCKDWFKNKFKSLRPSWKPSEEQMEALLWCTAHLGGADRRVLAELYEHLKKLI